MGVVVSLSTTPPTCIPYSYVNYSTLYVPKDSYAIYSKTNTWKDFKNIYEFDTLASSIELNKSEETIDAFSWSFLSATISPSDASIKECSWFSDNPRVASVDNTGKITGISPGTATITAKTIDGTNISDSCKVTINSVTPYITLSKSTATLAIDQKMALYYTIGNSYTKKATWSTNSRYVAYVTGTWDNGATIAGVADGEAIITATMIDNGVEYSASCKVIVGVGGIEVVDVDDNAVEVSRYDIHGRLLTEPTKGINIIKMSDGSTKKELIK